MEIDDGKEEIEAAESSFRKEEIEAAATSFSKDEIDHALFIRHTAKVQDKLNNARVAIAGLGGLGSNVALMLARAGVGQLHLIDHDKVDLTNINRQNYFLRHVGMYKTDAIREIIGDINPYIEVTSNNLYIKEEDVKELFKTDDIICEAFDLPENKAMFARQVRRIFPEKPFISASGMSGYGDSNSMVTRKLGNNWYICGDGGKNNNGGLMSARVMICAAHEANLILELIIDRK